MTRALSRVQAAGFRSLKSIDISLGRVTVLIGANGSGKSNLLTLLRMVPLMRTQSLRRFVGQAGGASALLHYGPQLTREVDLRLEFDGDAGAKNAYAARLGYAAGDTLLYLDEIVEYQAGSAVSHPPTSLGAGHAESRIEEAAKDGKNKTARAVRWWLSKLSFYHFHDTSLTSPLRQNSRQEDAHYLRSDGSNLAAYLWALQRSEGEDERKAFKRIDALVRRVAPFIKALTPTLVDPGLPAASAIRLDWIDERDQVFGPHQLSDGTLRAIALITALAQPSKSLPAFISIDEPELGLHPAALAIFASLVQSVAARCQVLLATQSPALLDLFAPGDVVVAERCAGETAFRRLEPDKLASWLEEYTLSELFDRNLLGGRP